MNHRSSVWIVSFALLAVAVAGASTAATDPEARAALRAVSPFASGDVAADRSSDATFALGVDAHEKKGLPGDIVSFEVLTKSRTKNVIELSVLSQMDGYRYEISPKVIEVGPDAPGAAKLVIQVPEDAAARKAVFGIVGVSESGEKHGLRVALYTAGDAPCRQNATDARCDGPKPIPCDRTLAANADQARCHPKPCDRATAADASTARCDESKPHPQFRMSLAQPRAAFPVGDDGLVHGRVALLFEGGKVDSIARLAPRMGEDAGWRLHIEESRVQIPAGERTWVWVAFTAKADASPLHYGIIAHSVDGDAHAKGIVGVAHDRPAPTPAETDASRTP